MERLKRVTDEKGLSIFDVEDAVALLAHQRRRRSKASERYVSINFASGFFFQVRTKRMLSNGRN